MFKSYTKTEEGEVEAKRKPMETAPGQVSVDYTPADAVIVQVVQHIRWIFLL